MKILNSQAIHELDNATCEKQQINSIDLMERAASMVSCEIISRFLPSQRFVFFAGPGNNGGDALAVARMLIEQGYRRVEVFLFNINGKLSHDCDEERNKLITLDGVDFTEVSREFTPPYLCSEDVVVDGLFGSGLNQPMTGGYTAVSRYINESGAYVISIDVPSGLFGEWNSSALRRDMIHADLTLTFQLPRLAFFFPENYEVVGEWKLLDIDLDEEKIMNLSTDFILVQDNNVRPLIPKRLPFSRKLDYGSVLLFAGSTGMMGAAVMGARAVMRSGAGLITVHGPWSGINILQTSVPEAIFEPDISEHFITDMTMHHNFTAVAAGPGIGTRDQTIDALEALLKEVKSPLVLDADALNCISKRPSLLNLLPPKTIITPHEREFDRLFGEHNSMEERLRTAIDMAGHYNLVIVLKSHYTMVVRPTGRVCINSTGNSGMATGGSGDVLTGVIASFLAQGCVPEYAATVGVYVHGLAGDMAAEKLGEYGMTAPDITRYLGLAVRRILNK